MKTSQGQQCDSCAVMSRGGDEFYKFVLPPTLSPITGLPDGKGFPGVASQSNPKMLAELLACPACIKRIMSVIQFTMMRKRTLRGDVKALQISAVGDTTVLPAGRLRSILEQIKQKYS